MPGGGAASPTTTDIDALYRAESRRVLATLIRAKRTLRGRVKSLKTTGSV
jgi:hypothetical protein